MHWTMSVTTEKNAHWSLACTFAVVARQPLWAAVAEGIHNAKQPTDGAVDVTPGPNAWKILAKHTIQLTAKVFVIITQTCTIQLKTVPAKKEKKRSGNKRNIRA